LKRLFMDSLVFGDDKIKNDSAEYFTFAEKRQSKSVLISGKKKRDCFLPSRSVFYFDSRQKEEVEAVNFRKKYKLFDSLNYRIVENFKKTERGNSYLIKLHKNISKRIEEYNLQLQEKKFEFLKNISIVRLWNASMLTAVLVGMVTMSFIYRYLGQSASAKNDNSNDVVGKKEVISQQMVKGDSDETWTKQREEEYIENVTEYLREQDQKRFQKKVKKIVRGYPIEKMLPYIFKQDRLTSVFLLAIAKKESNWGKRVPVLNGRDCYNYWGYRAKRKRMGTGGHTCFNSRADAVGTVGKRLHKLIYDYGRNTPQKLIIWKCGNSCSTHSDKSVRKWISDVDLYFRKLN